MIKTDRELEIKKEQCNRFAEAIKDQEQALANKNFSPEDIEALTGPSQAMLEDLTQEITHYENIKKYGIKNNFDIQCLGVRLIEKRIELGVTQKELANGLGIEESKLVRLENDEYHQAFSKLLKILEALNLTIKCSITSTLKTASEEGSFERSW